MHKILSLLLFTLLFVHPLVIAQSKSQKRTLDNKDIVLMVESKFSADVIKALIESGSCDFDISPTAVGDLKKKGVPDDVILLMIQKGRGAAAAAPPKRSRIKDELTESFKLLEPTVVTVWSEFGRGTGFIVDKTGLIVTNQHVVGPAEYIAVQFDAQRKIPARLLTSDAEKDVAILWANFDAIPEAVAAPVAIGGDEPTVVEGERVLTIGSPLHQRKIMTTGIVSRVEGRAIISDININKGNSGGPLFNSVGEVVGITTFLDPELYGPGLSGIVRIEEAMPLIERARKIIRTANPPDARLLPVDPTHPFPLEAIKGVAAAEDFDMPRYAFEIGEFDVLLMTPTVRYRIATQAEREAMKTRNKRVDKDGAMRGTFRPFESLREWAEYVGEYKPILFIQATPESGESFWGSFGRAMAASRGIYVRRKVRFKTDFYKMRLMCGETEVEPIHPAKVALLLAQNNHFVNAQDATYMGIYAYPAGAITTECGKVRIEVYSERNPEKARVKTLDEKTVARVEEDFTPYFQKHGRPVLQAREQSADAQPQPPAKTKKKNGEWWKMEADKH